MDRFVIEIIMAVLFCQVIESGCRLIAVRNLQPVGICYWKVFTLNIVNFITSTT